MRNRFVCSYGNWKSVFSEGFQVLLFIKKEGRWLQMGVRDPLGKSVETLLPIRIKSSNNCFIARTNACLECGAGELLMFGRREFSH